MSISSFCNAPMTVKTYRKKNDVIISPNPQDTFGKYSTSLTAFVQIVSSSA